MSRPKRSDEVTAADCDWSFTEDGELMARIKAHAQHLANAWGSVDADDIEQEMYLYLAVRPAVQRLRRGLILNKLRGRVRDVWKKESRQCQHQELPDE